MQVVVDPRIELMGILQLLAGSDLSTRYDFAYRRAVTTHFAPWMQHPAVTQMRHMRDAGFAFDAVPTLFLHCTPTPDLRVMMPLPPEMLIRAGGMEQVTTLVTTVGSFVADSQFQAFITDAQPLFDMVVRHTRPVVEAATADLAAYVGVPLDQSWVVLGLLLHHGGFGVQVETMADAGVDAYAVIGPAGVEADQPTFGDAPWVAELTQHELAHSVINPLTGHYAAEVKDAANQHAAIAEVMAAQAYATWPTIVNEHIIRAITIRLAAQRAGAITAARLAEAEQQRGFMYLPQLLNHLIAYEQQREQYPTIADYYPTLLRAFAAVATHGA
jgi:Domain of unknown function (DUF4932)